MPAGQSQWEKQAAEIMAETEEVILDAYAGSRIYDSAVRCRASSCQAQAGRLPFSDQRLSG